MKKKTAITLGVLNQKGGTAKSSTSLALGYGLAHRGYKVLLVDLDAQGNLTYATGVSAFPLSSLEILTKTATAKESIIDLGNISVIPASPSLAGSDILLREEVGKEYLLSEALEPIKGIYDYIIIDTPPSLSTLTVNALVSCDRIIIPSQADVFSLQGIGTLSQTVDTVKRRCNPHLKIDGILITRYNSRSTLSKDLKQMIEDTAKQLHTKVYKTVIRECTAVKESQAMRQDLFEYAPKSNAVADYNSFIDEILI